MAPPTQMVYWWGIRNPTGPPWYQGGRTIKLLLALCVASYDDPTDYMAAPWAPSHRTYECPYTP
eukprot:10948023-Karenia_brevis.AAC.1